MQRSNLELVEGPHTMRCNIRFVYVWCFWNLMLWIETCWSRHHVFLGAAWLKLLGGKLAPKLEYSTERGVPKLLVKRHPGFGNYCRSSYRYVKFVWHNIQYRFIRIIVNPCIYSGTHFLISIFGATLGCVLYMDITGLPHVYTNQQTNEGNGRWQVGQVHLIVHFWLIYQSSKFDFIIPSIDK